MAYWIRENSATLPKSSPRFSLPKKSVFISKFKWDIFLILFSGKIVNILVFWIPKIRPLTLHKGSSVLIQNSNIFGSNFVLENLQVCWNKLPRFSLFKIQRISCFGYSKNPPTCFRIGARIFGSKYVQIHDSEKLPVCCNKLPRFSFIQNSNILFRKVGKICLLS